MSLIATCRRGTTTRIGSPRDLKRQIFAATTRTTGTTRTIQFSRNSERGRKISRSYRSRRENLSSVRWTVKQLKVDRAGRLTGSQVDKIRTAQIADGRSRVYVDLRIFFNSLVSDGNIRKSIFARFKGDISIGAIRTGCYLYFLGSRAALKSGLKFLRGKIFFLQFH